LLPQFFIDQDRDEKQYAGHERSSHFERVCKKMLKERESMSAFGPLHAFAYPFLYICVGGCPLQNRQHIKREHKEQKCQPEYVSPGEKKRHFLA
jgi:hypothetical protein